MASRVLVGADVGGTFTDIVATDAGGKPHILKVPSSPPNYAAALVDGLKQFTAFGAGQPTELRHGTTVATNAVLQRAGARTALITTEGFRDVLELGRIRVPVLYDLSWEKPEPLVPRHLRFEVRERIDATGEVSTPLDIADAMRVIRCLGLEGVESVAVVFLHSYGNPSHERQIGDLISRELPEVSVSLSVDVLPELREFERTSTTTASAYVKPVMRAYLSALQGALADLNSSGPLYIMQSNGGMMTPAAAAERPVFTIESGPAAGVVAAAALTRELNIEDVLTFDMGGTTAKASLIEKGRPLESTEFEIGGRVSSVSRLIGGGGYLLRIPSLDVAEIGAGGGSLIWVDAGGSPHVGPQSMGSVPGPACYSLGNTRPTVTDANVVLGFLDQDALLGGELAIDSDRARAATQDGLADPLGLELMDAAYGAHLLANDNMALALRSVSSERGRDTRAFTLIAFGGNGPVHAALLAGSLGIPRIVIPPHPGLFSATGLLVGPIEHQVGETLMIPVHSATEEVIERHLETLEDRAIGELRTSGADVGGVTFRHSADMRYSGQSSELRVRLPADGDRSGHQLAALFADEHERTFGHQADEDAIQVVALRVTATLDGPRLSVGDLSGSDRGHRQRQAERSVYFGARYGGISTPVVNRADLPMAPVRGPLIVEEYDSTIVIPPRCSIRIDDAYNAFVDVSELDAVR